MRGNDTAEPSGRYLIPLAGALVLHALSASLFPTAGWTTPAGIGACNLVALALCLERGNAAEADAQWRWRLLAMAFLLWTMAFVALAYLQIRNIAMDDAQADSLFFMLRGVPLLLIVTRTDEGDRSARFRWIDIGQASLFALLVAALLFPRLASTDPAMPQVTEAQTLLFHEIQNYTLAIFALISLLGQTSPGSRRFTGLLCWLLWSYALVASLVNHWIILVLSPQPGSLLLLSADIPQALFIVLATRAGRRLSPRIPRFERAAASIRLIQPVLFSAGLMALSFAVSRVDFAVGFASGMLSLAFHAARSTLTQSLFLTAQRDLGQARDRLEFLASIDPLTSLPNRRRLDERLLSEWKRATRTHGTLAVLLIDVDQFKSFNDTAGHLAGDHCLREIAGVMQRSIRREADMIARYGGEEFVVIAPTMTPEGALALGEILRQAVIGRALPHPSNPTGIVTVSIGVAVTQAGQEIFSMDDLLRDADAALYKAKSLGRNCVRML